MAGPARTAAPPMKAVLTFIGRGLPVYRTWLPLTVMMLTTACAAPMATPEPYAVNRAAAEDRGRDFLETLGHWGIIVDGSRFPLHIMLSRGQSSVDRCVLRTKPIHEHDPEHISIARGAGVDITTEKYNCGGVGSLRWKLRKTLEILEHDLNRWNEAITVCDSDPSCVTAMEAATVNIFDDRGYLALHRHYYDLLPTDLDRPTRLSRRNGPYYQRKTGCTDTTWSGIGSGLNPDCRVRLVVPVPVGVLHDFVASAATSLENHIEVLGKYEPR